MDIEGLHGARGIAPVLEPVRNAGADDHQVLVDDWRRGDLGVEARYFAPQVRVQRRGTPRPKATSGLPVFASTENGAAGRR